LVQFIFYFFLSMPPVDTTSMDMTAEQMAAYSSASTGMSAGFLIIQIVFYILFAYSLFTLAKKLGEQYAWMAWVPVLNIVLMFRMAKMSLWWLLGLIVPIFNIYVYIKALHNGISVRTGHGGWWTV
jgi:Family of unknown function (DUF5684)